MPLNNAQTTVPVERSVSAIMALLAKNGASQIMTEYDAAGEIAGLKWSLESEYGRMGYSLPINYDAVFKTLTTQRVHVRDLNKRTAQSRRVAWRIVHDWVRSQLGLLESGMVEMEEIFLPYMLAGDGRTVYQALSDGKFRALNALASDAIALPSPDDGPG